MTQILTRSQIESVLAKVDISTLITQIEEGFMAYSSNEAVVPPVGTLRFSKPRGDMHVKYGYIQGDDTYVVKVASSFYDNPKHGLPSSNGTVLVFSQKTGELIAILLDEGYLTDVRTGVAGAVIAKHFAPSKVETIGIIGTGTQARMQLKYLQDVLSCQSVYVYGRSEAAMQQYIHDMQPYGFTIKPAVNIAELMRNCNYVITTTPATRPLITADMIRPGIHITAIGADTPGKQELDPHVLQQSDILIADSINQCRDYGEIHQALQVGAITEERIVELGRSLINDAKRQNDTQLTVAVLTGVAVQDIQIATAVLNDLT